MMKFINRRIVIVRSIFQLRVYETTSIPSPTSFYPLLFPLFPLFPLYLSFHSVHSPQFTWGTRERYKQFGAFRDKKKALHSMKHFTL